jgi:hypothetical protein
MMRIKMKQFLEDIWYWIYDHLIWPELEVYRNMKWFIQRGRRGYSDRDLLDLGGYISWWMPDALRKMMEEYGVCITNVPYEVSNKIMYDIIDAFESAREVLCGDWDGGYNKRRKFINNFQEKGKLFIKHFFDLWT